MDDISLDLPARPGALAHLGEVLGAARISLEGGGVFTINGVARAHFLVENGEKARSALLAAGYGAVDVRPVLIRRLNQEVPGQLGAIARALGDAGVNIQTQYSDHSNRLILVVDDVATAQRVTGEWAV